MKPMRWTSEDKAKIAKMWSQGLSLDIIGQRMGCSRNAISGVVHRMDLPPRRRAERT